MAFSRITPHPPIRVLYHPPIRLCPGPPCHPHALPFSFAPFNSTSPVSYPFGCLAHPSPVVFAIYHPIRLSSWSPFTLQSHLSFHPPLFRPSYSRICLPFLASYPDALPAHLPFNPPRSSYPHIRISSTHATPQPLFPAGRNTQNHSKMSVFYFPGLGQWTVRENNSEPRCWNCGIRSVDWTVRAALM